MARLASQAKKGYYKTPVSVISLIAKYLQVAKAENTYLLDPCCGKGEAMALLADELGITRQNCYGNELDELRYEECKKYNIHTTCGDATSELKSEENSFGILYLNPPYDNGDEYFIRTEFNFLISTYKYLSRGGICIFVVPEHILHHRNAHRLHYLFKQTGIFRFPEKEYQAFKQVVFIGIFQRGKSPEEERNFCFQRDNPKTLGDESDTIWTIPQSQPAQYFYSDNLTKSGVEQMLKNPAIASFVEKEAIKGFNTVQDKKIRSLMGLRTGHMALMLASGVMNGVYRCPVTRHTVIVHGKTIRKEKTLPTQTNDKGDKIRRKINSPVPTIKAFDLDESIEKDEIICVDYI